MATKADKLREQAAKARRLARGISDPLTQDALKAYADQAEAEAKVIDAREAGQVGRDKA